MILVLSGTGDGRTIVKALSEKGYKILATTATPYGGQLLADSRAEETVNRPLNEKALIKIISEREITAIVDVTHPYAEAVSRLAIDVCQKISLPYIRYERPELHLPEQPLLIHTSSYHQAAEKAAFLGETIFLTTGSKTLDIFLQAARAKGRRVIARVLPQPQILQRCLDLGLTPAEIVAMQGPFTRELNISILRQYQASVLVTKNSGVVGGLDTKIDAALKLQIPVVIVDRPQLITSRSVSTITDLLLELDNLKLN